MESNTCTVRIVIVIIVLLFAIINTMNIGTKNKSSYGETLELQWINDGFPSGKTSDVNPADEYSTVLKEFGKPDREASGRWRPGHVDVPSAAKY